MLRKILFTLFLFLGFTQLYGQKEAAIWYFGENAGLDFNSGAPVALLDGQIRTQEGCSVISDFNGDLLFYTDGIKVWNRNHDLMPNGSGLNGSPSSTQSGIIVPAPGNPDIYYVFTVDDLAGVEGLQYSIVDLSLNGGLGDITVKNVLLETPVLEKLTAVIHANGTDVWIMAHRSLGNEYIAYLVTAAGVSTSPIVSNIGLPATEASHTVGYLKFSPDGNFLASASSKGNYLQLFRFDNATGAISDFLEFESFYNAIAGTKTMGNYGVAFSSDSRKLYIQSTIYFNFPNPNSSIYQFDLSNYDAAAIEASATLVASQAIEIGALQLAVDGKIYAAQFDQHYLGVINNPNVAGVGADYVSNGLSLGAKKSRLGLPPFIQTYFIVGLRASKFCLGDNTEFSVATSDPITAITWDFGDGNGSSVESPVHIYATPGNYVVSVTVITASGTKTETKEITIYEMPVANTASDYEICNVSSGYEFDLSTKNAEILGSQSVKAYAISYHTSLADANLGTSALIGVYRNTNATETIYARVYNVQNPNCYAVTKFDVIVKKAPELMVVTDWTVCDDNTDGSFIFDLGIKDAEILGKQDASIFNISYHGSRADAVSGDSPLSENYSNVNASEFIFFRIGNSIYPQCYETGSFRISVTPSAIANAVGDILVCDDDNDGISTFDLTSRNSEILGGQDPGSFVISYHTTQYDADNGANMLNASAFTNSSPDVQTIYARIQNYSGTDCYDTTSFDLIVTDTPVLRVVTNWEVCDDDNDGVYGFNLSEKKIEILGDRSIVDFNISFYESLSDADRNLKAIAGMWKNTSRKQKVFYRLENIKNADCYIVGSFNIGVYDIPFAKDPTPFFVCERQRNERQGFDLSAKDFEILGSQDPSVYSVLYYASEIDAMLSENPLVKTNYSNSLPNEVVYARVQNDTLEECYGVVPLEIIVNPLPRIFLEPFYVICPDNPELELDGGDFDAWSWRDGSGVELGSDRTFDFTETGNFSLTVSNTGNGTSCFNTRNFEVLSSGVPEALDVEMGDFSDKVNITLSARGVGEFEYSIDGVVFQSDKRFEVFPGQYKVYVRDVLQCRTISDTVTIMGYEKFFTPNGDTSHEHWNIIGGDRFPNSVITIYDRYGRLLKQLSPTQKGWDGTFNGMPLPASDYWFRLVYDNGKLFTGHFSLKR